MKLLNIFKSKEKREEERIAKEAYESREITGYCFSCGAAIELGERYTKQQGKYYHKKCWKDLLKSAW